MDSINRFRRAFALRALTRKGVQSGVVWLSLFGASVLLLKLWREVDARLLSWLIAAALVPIIARVALELRSVPTTPEVRRLLDRHNRAGGLLVSSGETDIGAWSERIEALRVPTVRWRGGKDLCLLAAAVLFAVFCVLAPRRTLAGDENKRLNVDRIKQDISASVEKLEQEGVFSDQEADRLKESLEDVAKNADASRPSETWNALNDLENKIADMANKRLLDEADPLNRLGQAEQLANALAESEKQPESLGETMKALADQVREALKQSAFSTTCLAADPKTAEALREATRQLSECPSKEALRQLREALKKLGKCQGKKLDALTEVSLIDARLLKKLCRNCRSGKCSRGIKDLVAFMEKEGDCDKAALVACLCSEPGQGGVSRGRGDAPLTWKDPAGEEGTAFKEQAVAPNMIDVDDSRSLGVSSAPDAKPERLTDVSRAGGLSAAAAGGGGAARRVILPQYKATLDRYFERK